MPTTYVPITLGAMIRSGRRGVLGREGDGYCMECKGKVGDLSQKYGALIIEGTIAEIDQQLADHDPTHNVTVVDRGNCKMGM